MEINQCVGCTRYFFTKSFLGDDVAALARLSASAVNLISAQVSAAMGVQLFGSDSLITIMAPGWIFYGVAAAAGPIVAYCVSQNRVYRGKSEAGAYNPFFYAAAGLSFGNFLLVATMGWLERRAVAAERAAERG